MLRYMLDTNITIYVIKKRPIEVLKQFNANAGSLCISSITLAELLHGAEKSERVAHNHSVIDDFVSRLTVLDYDIKAALHYGQIRAALEKQGKTIGINDLHIGAHARSQGLSLVSNNLREFARIPGLVAENWVG